MTSSKKVSIFSPCPFCGGNPRMAKSQYAISNKLPDVFIMQCSKCFARTIDTDTKQRATDNWEDGEFTPETIMLSKPLDPDNADMRAAINMVTDIMRSAATAYMRAVRSHYKYPTSLSMSGDMAIAERFYYTSPFIRIMGLDPDDIVQTLRRRAMEVKKDEVREKKPRNRENNAGHKRKRVPQG